MQGGSAPERQGRHLRHPCTSQHVLRSGLHTQAARTRPAFAFKKPSAHSMRARRHGARALAPAGGVPGAGPCAAVSLRQPWRGRPASRLQGLGWQRAAARTAHLRCSSWIARGHRRPALAHTQPVCVRRPTSTCTYVCTCVCKCLCVCACVCMCVRANLHVRLCTSRCESLSLET